MQTLRNVFEKLLSRRFQQQKILDSNAPSWPPDVFGLAASIVNLSGIHLNAKINGPNSLMFNKAYIQDVVASGEEWRQNSKPPKRVHELWEILIDSIDKDLTSNVTKWGKAAIELVVRLPQNFGPLET